MEDGECLKGSLPAQGPECHDRAVGTFLMELGCLPQPGGLQQEMLHGCRVRCGDCQGAPWPASCWEGQAAHQEVSCAVAQSCGRGLPHDKVALPQVCSTWLTWPLCRHPALPGGPLHCGAPVPRHPGVHARPAQRHAQRWIPHHHRPAGADGLPGDCGSEADLEARVGSATEP